MAVEKILFKIEYDNQGAVVGLKATKDGFQDIDLTVKNAEKSVQKLNQMIASTGGGANLKGIKLTTKEYDKLIKTQNQLKSASGGATATVMELGRVISDAPYGIRGMANNLTQLVSMFAFTTKSAGGLVNGLKSIWKALMGPLGVVLAITSVISILDGLYGANKKAEKSTDENTKALKRQVKPLEKLINLYKSLKSVLFSDNDSEALIQYKNGLLTLDETVKIISRNFNEFQNAYDKLTDSQKQDEKSVKAILDGYSELLNLRKLEEKQISRMSVLRKDVSKKGETISRNGLTFIREEAKELGILEGQYIKTQKRLIQLEGFFSKEKGSKEFKGEIQEITKLIGEGFQDLEMPKIKGLDIIPEGKTLDDLIPSEYDETAFAIEQYKTLMSGLTDFVGGEFERQLTIEQNKTNVLNAELNQRLLNEKLSADERKNIQNQIAQNDEDLRKKQNKIKKKQFNTQKAFNIAMATADTYLAGVKVLADPFFTGRPWERAIAMTATIASGLASVAAIARQKFQPMAPSTPSRVSTGGGSSATTQSRQPIFNIVGRSSESQLAEVIQGQFNKPVKAYVVSKEVTTQQQLDLNIQSSASI